MDSNINILNSKAKDYHKISVAPMLGISTPQFRYFMRLLSRHSTLYTEMVHHDTILHRDYKQILEFDEIEHPVVLQLGGNDPERLGLAAKYAKELGYDEINLNCGCPSNKVQEASFGAYLMSYPDLVAECTNSIYKHSNIVVTVKCRLGLNKDNDEFLDNFIETVSKKGNVSHFIMHARLAIMNIDPVKNRSIPPLNYKKVYDLRKKYNHINFSINGGIKDVKEITNVLDESNDLAGCMIGRAAYDNPWLFSDFDRVFYKKANPGYSRKEILYKYSDYCDKVLEYKSKGIVFELVKPILYLCSGEPYSTVYKNELTKVVNYMKENECNFSDFIKHTIDLYEKDNNTSLDKTPPNLN